ncbi:hypothetical protein N0V94_009044 [Neodidymelliopsis sp. IMI 364377]|nr:hypothetical protein N0V94_009044 [Neodidymelliopsis sp. IMI 364377]
MRANTFIMSSLLAIAISGAPVKRQELAELSVGHPDLELPSVPKVPTGPIEDSLPGVPSAFSTTIPAELLSVPTGVPRLPAKPKLPVGDVKLPVENLPLRRADLPIVDSTLEGVKLAPLPKLPKLPTGDLKLPIKRADLPAVDGLTNGVKVPALPTNDVKLPKLPEAGNVLKDVTSIDGVNPKVDLPLSISTGLKNRRTVNTSIPVNVDVDVDHLAKQVNVDDLTKKVNLPAVDIPAVDVPAVDVPTVNVSKVDVRTDAPAVSNLPRATVQSRQVVQDIPVVGDVDAPSGLPKVQVGTLDKYVGDVVKGTTGI